MKKSDVKNVKDFEDYYSKVRKIKFRDNLEINNILDVKRELLVNKEATVYTRNGHHTDKGRARSFDDFFKISKFYFPEKTTSEIAKEFINEDEKLIKNGKPVVYLGYCGTIRKSNTSGLYIYGSCCNDINYRKQDKLEFGFNKSFSFEEIINS